MKLKLEYVRINVKSGGWHGVRQNLAYACRLLAAAVPRNRPLVAAGFTRAAQELENEWDQEPLGVERAAADVRARRLRTPLPPLTE